MSYCNSKVTLYIQLLWMIIANHCYFMLYDYNVLIWRWTQNKILSKSPRTIAANNEGHSGK